MSYDSCKNIGWISLLDGAGKLELLDLLTAIETCLISEQQEWIQQNILAVHKHAASTTSLNRLLDYCNQIMVSHPDIIFKSNDIALLPKETLITLLKSDELGMDEDDIWISAIQWSIRQVPELRLGNDPNDWSSNDINTVKDIIADFIPHIRFFSITPNKVAQYYDLLPRKLCCDLLNINFIMDKSYKPSTCILPPRKGRQSPIYTTLNLSDCQIGNTEATALAKAVELNFTVYSLNFAYSKINKITKAKATTVLEKTLSIRKVFSVTSLDLQGNQIGDAGATALAKALESNSSLDLGNNKTSSRIKFFV